MLEEFPGGASALVAGLGAGGAGGGGLAYASERDLGYAVRIGKQQGLLLWPAHYMWTQRKQEIFKYIPMPWLRAAPSSLWLRKVH